MSETKQETFSRQHETVLHCRDLTYPSDLKQAKNILIDRGNKANADLNIYSGKPWYKIASRDFFRLVDEHYRIELPDIHDVNAAMHKLEFEADHWGIEMSYNCASALLVMMLSWKEMTETLEHQICTEPFYRNGNLWGFVVSIDELIKANLSFIESLKKEFSFYDNNRWNQNYKALNDFCVKHFFSNRNLTVNADRYVRLGLGDVERKDHHNTMLVWLELLYSDTIRNDLAETCSTIVHSIRELFNSPMEAEEIALQLHYHVQHLRPITEAFFSPNEASVEQEMIEQRNKAFDVIEELIHDADNSRKLFNVSTKHSK